MRIRQILILVLLVSFISGCWVARFGEVPGSHDEIDLLKSFIGQKSEGVVRELGIPNEFLSDGDQRFMLYSARSSDYRVLFIGLVPERDGHGITLYCLRFELDSDNVVKKYRRYSRPYSARVPGVNIFWVISSCREAYWSKQERVNLKTETIFITWQDIEAEKAAREAEKAAREAEKAARKLEQDASKGDADAQLTLFKELRGQDTDQALGWLCKSADLDNQEARDILAKIYEHGGYVWVKNNVVRQNYKLAYAWHGLSGLYDQEDLQFFADRHLTATELSEAKNLLREWRPGQCERDLGLVSHSVSAIPPPEFDLSGIYTSKVLRKGNADYFCFDTKRTFMIELKQEGNRIKGTFLSGITGEIEGTITNKKVEFTWYTTRCNRGTKGEWTVDSGGSNLKGFGWSDLTWEAQKNN